METHKTLDSTDGVVRLKTTLAQDITSFLLRWGFEIHGISPTLEEDRTDKRLYQMFFLWLSVNTNIPAFSFGTAGPAFFNLGLRDAILIILVADPIASIIPAAFTAFGPKLGTRAMVQARFSWGYFGSVIPSILNVLSMQGYLILLCIVGGQTIASVSPRLNDTVGIVIISVLTLIMTIFGYRMLHWLESWAWIPNVLAYVIMLGVSGKHLHPSSIPSYPAPAVSTVLSFASFLAAVDISWCTMTPDYGVFHDPRASSFRIFIYSYAGFLVGNITSHILGATFAAVAPNVPSWKSGFGNGNNVGGLVNAILSPTGGFGECLMVVLALSICSACVPSMYTFGTSFMSIAPIFVRVPRYVFAFVSEAFLIPIAIIGATRFYTVLVDIVDGIGYWCAAFAAIVLCEHFVFRRNDFSMYDTEDWNKPHQLPLGVAATLAFTGAFGIIIPSMSQVWYSGPIAVTGTGDIGIPAGFVVSGVLYLILRTLERRWTRRRDYL